MRFATLNSQKPIMELAYLYMLIACVMTTLALPVVSFAQVGVVYDLNVSEKTSGLSIPAKRLQKQARGQGTLQAIEGLIVSEEMIGLGQISDIDVSSDGTLFVSDRRRGRIWSITDRGLDGKLDGRRPICGDFDRPSGLAVDSYNAIYIADQIAVWKCDIATGKRREYVSLRATQSGSNLPRPLSLSPKDGALVMGLNEIKSVSETVSKLIRIDPKDKKAELLATYNAPISAIAIRPQGDIWLTVGNVFINSQTTNGQRLEGFAKIVSADQHVLGGLIVPGQFATPENWPNALHDHILITQSGTHSLPNRTSGGMNLVAIPTEFGAPVPKIQVIVDGFLSSRRGGAWGRPGPMVMDRRGIYFGESWQGSLWRVSARPVAEPSQKQVAKVQTLENDGSASTALTLETTQRATNSSQTPPSLIGQSVAGSQVTGSSIDQGSKMGQGSSIQSGSSILKGSGIEVGSYLVRDYEAQKAKEAQIKKDQEEKDKVK